MREREEREREREKREKRRERRERGRGRGERKMEREGERGERERGEGEGEEENPLVISNPIQQLVSTHQPSCSLAVHLHHQHSTKLDQQPNLQNQQRMTSACKTALRISKTEEAKKLIDGKLVWGTITHKNSSFMLVDIGFKAEAKIRNLGA